MNHSIPRCQARWEQRYTKAEKYVGYHPCDLAHANIERYTRWSGSL